MGSNSGKAALAVVAAILLTGAAGAADKRPPAPPKPQPIGNPGDWFPADAYPKAAIDEGVEGRTAFLLNVDAKGTVTGCSIVSSSGSALLDLTTCTLLRANAHFKPALGPRKRPVASNWKSAMRWTLLNAPPAAETPAP